MVSAAASPKNIRARDPTPPKAVAISGANSTMPSVEPAERTGRVKADEGYQARSERIQRRVSPIGAQGQQPREGHERRAKHRYGHAGERHIAEQKQRGGKRRRSSARLQNLEAETNKQRHDG